MSPTRSELTGALGALALPLLLLTATSAAAQQPDRGAAARILSHEVSISRNSATLRLELEDGRVLHYALQNGGVEIDGRRIGDAPRGDDLDRSWRELLNRVMESGSEELPTLLSDWSPAGGGSVGERLDAALEEAARGAAAGERSAALDPAAHADSMARLQARIAELEQRAAASADPDERHERFDGRDRWRPGPFHYFVRGFGQLFSVLVVFAILFAIGVGIIFFGGRKYLEGVADTARHATTRSLLVGIAGTFLVLPAFVLGVIALVVSLVGIPALLVFIPGFWLALVGALLLGYLGIAHAGGEALAERRFYMNDWFERANSYYFLLTGLGLLLVFFAGSAIVSMAGPWLKVISGLLTFFAVVTTWAAFTTGFGAVLISRGGTRPVRTTSPLREPDLFSDEAVEP